MLQQGQQRHRCQRLGHRAGQQPQEYGGGCFDQFFAGAVVGDDAMARQSGGHAAGEFTIGGDQGGGAAGGFDRRAQDHRDRFGFFLSVTRAQAPQTGRGRNMRVLPGAERFRRQQGAGEQREAGGRDRVPRCGEVGARIPEPYPVMAGLDRAIRQARHSRWLIPGSYPVMARLDRAISRGGRSRWLVPRSPRGITGRQRGAPSTSRMIRPSPLPHIRPRRVQSGQQIGQTGLRMTMFHRGPGVIGHQGVEDGQDNAAQRRPGDHTGKARDSRDSGRCAGDHHRVVRRLRLPRRRLRVQQRDLAGGGVHHAVFRQPVRPRMGHDAQERQRTRPMRGISRIGGIRQTRGEVDFRAIRLVHQHREFHRQQPGAIGRARCATRTVHTQDQIGQHRQPAMRIDRRPQRQRTLQRQRRLIQSAQCDDARQQQAPCGRHAQERLGE